MALLLSVMFAAPNSATTLRVPQQWPTIAGAIGAAVSGDTVQVAAGVYSESLDFGGRNLVLSGAGPGSTILQGNGTRLLQFVSNEGPQAELTGFTLRMGTAPPGSRDLGGAVLVHHASPTLRGNHFEQNGARQGGALALLASTSLVEHNTFDGNQAFMGGAVLVLGGEPRLAHNRFAGNLGGERGYGGAVALESTAATVEHNLFTGNGAFLGGALSVRQSPLARAEHNTLHGNHSRLGGGVYLGASDSDLRANLVSGSTAGGALGTGLQALPTLACQLHHGNTGGDGFPGQDLGGNRVLDPRFCDPDGGDFRLQPDSPCYTADCAVIGYTEENCSGVAVDAAPTRPGGWTLASAPNPFNAATRLTVDAPAGQPWTLDLFGITGARVARLAHSTSGGPASLLLDAHHPGLRTTPLAAGVYLLRLDHAGGTLCSKVIFLP